MSDKVVMVAEDTRKVVCVDLDGVLNLYDGWKGENHFAEPRPGAKEFMAELAEHYRVIVFTTRFPPDVMTWLHKHDIPFWNIVSSKPPAVAYIDDRAICFTGSFDGLVERVQAFKAHWET